MASLKATYARTNLACTALHFLHVTLTGPASVTACRGFRTHLPASVGEQAGGRAVAGATAIHTSVALKAARSDEPLAADAAAIVVPRRS